MPNFWSSTTQKIYEVFNGPRTKDVEFNQKVEEMQIAEKSMQQVKTTIKNFPAYLQGLRQLCIDVNNYFIGLYSNESIYFPFIKDVINAHKDIEVAYNSCVEIVNALVLQANDWDKLFLETKDYLKQREDARRVYDHYDEKMEKLVNARNVKLQKKIPETVPEIERFERNDLKYKKAADDFLKLSGFTFKQIQELLDYRYQVVNPVIAGFVNEERKLFVSCVEYLSKFDNIMAKLQGLDRGFKKTVITYDPAKHVRANRLLLGINTSDLPPVKSKEKYSYEDYKKSKLGGTSNVDEVNTVNTQPEGNKFSNVTMSSMVNDNNNNNISNKPNSNVNEFSYEAYKARSGLGNQSQMKSKTVTEVTPSQTFNQNTYNAFANVPNSFSNQTTQNLLRNTTIIPATTNTVQEDQQGSDTFNPYSSISFNPQVPNTSNMNTMNRHFATVQSNNYGNMTGMNTSVQHPQTTSMPSSMGSNLNISMPTQQVNKFSNINPKAARGSGSEFPKK